LPAANSSNDRIPGNRSCLRPFLLATEDKMASSTTEWKLNGRVE
jgi:hypothetical protein